MKKHITSFVARMSSVRLRSFLFLAVVVFAVVVADQTKEACAASCGRPPLYECPSSIVVWGNASIPFVGYGQGLLPNGHEYCVYYGPHDGDPFSGTFDRVQGRQVTFAREMDAQPCYTVTVPSTSESGNDGGTYTYCLWVPTGNAYEISWSAQGTKCVNPGFWDPYLSPNWGAGTHTNYFIYHDCTGSYHTYKGLSTAAGSPPMDCYSTFARNVDGSGSNQQKCEEVPSIYLPWYPYRISSVTPPNVCVDVGFQ